MDISVYAAWLRGPGISQNIQQIFKKYPKIDYRAFASSRDHYVADNRTARDIQHFGLFWVVKIQGGGGNAPLAPLIKISLVESVSLGYLCDSKMSCRRPKKFRSDSGLFLSSYRVNIARCNLCARAKVKGHIKLKIEENTSVGKLVEPFQIW